MRAASLILFAAGVLIGLCCSKPSSSSEGSEASEVEAEGEGEAEAEAGSEDRALPERVFYALGAHLERAELRHGDTRVVDFGTPSGAQHTLGGWRTRTGPDVAIEGTSALMIEGVIGELLLPSDRGAAATLTLRARTFAGDGRATLYVNEDSVHHVRFPRDAFGVVQVELPSGVLVPGENRLQIRVPGRGRFEGRHAGIAIDWLRLGEGDAPPPDLTQPLPAGWSLSWTFEPPAGARLIANGAEVRVHREDGSTDTPTEDALVGGEPIRLELIATRPLDLRDARVLVREPARPRRRVGTTLPEIRPRNVIVWLVDTVRADKLSPWNPDTRVETPGLARWARRAVVFDQARTQENWTKPSVATLLTGLLPWQHTALSGEAVLPRSVEMLSETLQDAGFATAGFVCNGYVSRTFGFHQGWDSWRNYIKEGRRTAARFVASDVLSWLDEREPSKPFFLYVHTIDPHVPYIPPDDVLARYDGEPYDGPVDFTRDRELLEKIKAGSLRLNARDKRRLEALYDGEITYHDAHFAAVLQGLERRGLADDTLVVFTADHGEELFDHDSVGHGHSLFEELLHVPLVMRIPGTDATRVDEPVGLVDVMPTILDALGRPPSAESTGRSVLPLIRGAHDDAPRASIAGFLNGWRSIVEGRWKLIQRTHNRWMLFDLRSDPGERHDVAARHPLVVRYLRGLLGVSMQGDTRHAAEDAEIDDETREQLEALGYVGGQPR